VINDSQLTLGDVGKMKLDTGPFRPGMVELMNKKVFVTSPPLKRMVSPNQDHYRVPTLKH
jgi:hypothetical protein